MEAGAREQELVPAGAHVGHQAAEPPRPRDEHRVGAGDEGGARVLGGEPGRVRGDVAPPDPLHERVGARLDRARAPVDVALEELVGVHEGAVGVGEDELVPQLPHGVLRAGLGQRDLPGGDEGVAHGLELGQGRRHAQAPGGEHVLVVVDEDVLAVVGDAVPVAVAHEAVLGIAGGGLEGGGERLVPAAPGGLLGQGLEKALGGELARGGVALVVLHNVRHVVACEDDLGVLLELLEGLRLVLDGDLGVLLLEDLDGASPGLAHGRVVGLVVPDGEGVRALAGGAAAGEPGTEQARGGAGGEEGVEVPAIDHGGAPLH